jgi:hypothetical protein
MATRSKSCNITVVTSKRSAFRECQEVSREGPADVGSHFGKAVKASPFGVRPDSICR